MTILYSNCSTIFPYLISKMVLTITQEDLNIHHGRCEITNKYPHNTAISKMTLLGSQQYGSWMYKDLIFVPCQRKYRLLSSRIDQAKRLSGQSRSGWPISYVLRRSMEGERSAMYCRCSELYITFYTNGMLYAYACCTMKTAKVRRERSALGTLIWPPLKEGSRT